MIKVDEPNIKSLLPELLAIGMTALLWRTTQWLSPSMGMAVVGIVLFIALAIFYVKQPTLKPTLKWASLIFLGGCLNFAAIFGNGGMMPYPHVMSPVWWVWLGDWIGGLISPGDILMVIGFVGIITTMVANRRQKVVEEA